MTISCSAGLLRARSWWLLLAVPLFTSSCAPDATLDDGSERSERPLFTNGGFEAGTFGSWTKTAGLNATGLSVVPPTTEAQLQLGAGGSDFTFVRTNGTPESQVPAGLTTGTGVPLWPRFGQSSAVINEYNATPPPGMMFAQGANTNVNSIRQSMATTFADVDPSDDKVHVRFVLAPVLQAAGHDPNQQPYFFAIIRNTTAPRAGVVYTNFNFANQAGVPWQSQGTGTNAFLFTPWQIFDVAPSAAQFQVGDTLQVEVFAAGCQPGGHAGSAYVDGFGEQLPSLFISKAAPALANIDSDITYTFTVKNNTSGIAPNVVADEVLPDNTTFVSASAPGATCTTPAVGATGTVSCTYGWMNPGAAATFTVTVHAYAPSTQGTVTAATTARIDDTGQAWAANGFQGFTAYLTSGALAGQQAVVTTNTATRLNVTPAWPAVPANGTTFKVINPPAFVGTASAGGGTTITKSGAASWVSNQWVGWNVVLLSGTGAPQTQPITTNSTNQLTVANWTTNPNNTTVFAITRPVMSVVNGNYGVTGPTVSRLLGPKRETQLGVGATFANLSIVKTDSRPAVTWGSSTTYTITVSNAGPATATNATVVDTLPAQIASATWTCTGAGGGTCTASGMGSLNQSVTLPSGASVTFTVNATLIAGMGAGAVANLATVTTPAGVTDPFPDDNSSVDQNAIATTLRLLTVTKDPTNTGTGTVTSSPAAIACGPACPSASASFADGAAVMLTAVAVPNNTFLGWSGGGCTGNAPTCTVTMSAAQTVTVRFTSCGNAVRELGEGCDDGNLTAGDGCNGSCLIENTRPCNASMPGLTGGASCASGVCDATGNPAPGVCEPAATCGNGVREAGEGCDDGNTTAGDGCNATCRIENARPCNASTPGLTGNTSCASGVCDTTGNPAPGVCEAAATCGNGTREAGEGCDDGNTTAGDGCNATCRVENGGTCNAAMPGLTGNASCASGLCDSVGNPAPGRCESATGCGNSVREATEGCDDGNTTAGDGCSATCLVENTRPCNASMPGLTGGASCVSGICDTTSGAPGVCEPAATCGNSVREANEGCDDGNTANGDGCSATCRIENTRPCNASMPGLVGGASCASGVCDTTSGMPGVCEPSATCGNSVRDANEGCDDGNTTAGDGCSATCLVENTRPCNASMPGLTGGASCVSGICDVTSGAPGVCEPAATCGNSVREANEGCDDGNTASGDGCSATCRIENTRPCNASMPGLVGGASCASGICDVTSGAPGVCEPAATCGNSVREANEGCDDGNTAAGDGCSATCLVENTRPCNASMPGLTGSASCASGICDVTSGAPGVCEPAATCGNSVREANEGCDDGNTTAGDGCTATCLLEDGRACNAMMPGATGAGSCASGVCDTTSGMPGVCEPSNTCGNGKREGAEGCDDGNTASGDGCSATCVSENACGNGVRESGEGCDDSNTAGGDGCSAACLIEDGRACNATMPGRTGGMSCASSVCDTTGNAAPGVCEAANACGNGVREASEGCDDGNTAAGDGCTAACLVENGRPCGPGGSSSCASGKCDLTSGAPGVCRPPDTKDTDGDGVNDADDLDDDNDGLADTVEGGPSTDTDGDGVPDRLDLDSDNDGILDAFEAGHGATVAPSGTLACPGGVGANGLCNAVETAADSGAPSFTARDTDGDGVPDFRDLDSDDDGIFDTVEGGSACVDTTGDAICDGGDTDGDGIVNGADPAGAAWGSGTVTTPPDTDGDGAANFRDLDSDDDGLHDLIEGGAACVDASSDALCDGDDADHDGLRASSDGAPAVRGTTAGAKAPDTDGDGRPDFRDLDSDDDALSDLVEGGSTCTDAGLDGVCDPGDADGDGLTDSADGAPMKFGSGADKKPAVPDTDGDGTHDFRDLDSDGDGVFDVVRAKRARLDADRDGRIDEGPDADADGIRDSIDATPDQFGGLAPPPELHVIGGGCSCGSSSDLGPLLLLGGLVLVRRRRLHRAALTAALALGATLALHAAPASAQAQSAASTAIDVQLFKPAPGRYDILNTFSTETCGARCPTTSLWLQYANNPLLVASVGSKQRVARLVDHQLTIDLMQSWGLTDAIDIAVHLPLYGQSTGQADLTDPRYVGAGWSFGAGDLRIIPRVRFWRSSFGLAIALAVPIVLPTGRTDAFMGGGFIAVHPRLIGGYHKGRLHVDLNLGANLRRLERLENIRFGSEFAWNLAAEYRIVDEGRLPLGVQAAVYGVVGLTGGGSDSGDHPVEALVAARAYPAKPWAVGLALGRGLVAGYGSPDVRVMASVAFTPELNPPAPLDSDGDGLPDAADQCPADAEDRDCFADDDGCPDPDNDRDGILDGADQCRNEPETVNGIDDRDGCPEKDSDGDGIFDPVDHCPLVPETVNGTNDTDGCPEKDTDGDGLFDDVDQCPSAREDPDGFEDLDGCPDPDDDHDGIPDVVDKCPREPETINGVNDTDGCPDQGDAKVKLEGDKILILDKVYFATNKDVILERSFNLLMQVAATLQAHPELLKVRVEGHTDSQGNDAANLDLSQRRANSVKRFLIDRGVGESRLDAVGYGETKPVGNNLTAAGREANRRVEFVVVDHGK